MVADNGEQVTGFRIALVFEGGVPEVSAPEVKALLDPIIDFGVKNSREAYAQTLPPFLKDAIDHHDVLVGMNRRMVIASAGAPESKIRELVPGSENDHYEEWIYGKVPADGAFHPDRKRSRNPGSNRCPGPADCSEDGERTQGYLDPLDTHEIAMGDQPGGAEEEGRAAGPPPTLREPGDPLPPNSAQRVQYPVPHKEKPLPPAPGSPADTTTSTQPIAPPVMPGRGAGGLDPSMTPAAGSPIPGADVPGKRVN